MALEDDDRIVVVDRRGNARSIPISDIEAAKVFPL
jgi:hypothetical protein